MLVYPLSQVFMAAQAIVITRFRWEEDARFGRKFVVVRVMTVVTTNFGLLVAL